RLYLCPLCHLCPLPLFLFLFLFPHTAPTKIYTLSLHDALPIYRKHSSSRYSMNCRWERCFLLLPSYWFRCSSSHLRTPQRSSSGCRRHSVPSHRQAVSRLYGDSHSQQLPTSFSWPEGRPGSMPCNPPQSSRHCRSVSSSY